MPRINPKPPKEYPWYVRMIFWLQKKKYGAPLDSAKIWARSPKLFLGLSMFFKSLDRNASPISPQLRNLIFIYISKIIKCPFCVDINSARFIESQGEKSLLTELDQYESSTLFSEREKAALKYVEGMCATPLKITEEIFLELKRHFSEDEIVELTGLIAFQNCSARFNTALDIPAQGFYSD